MDRLGSFPWLDLAWHLGCQSVFKKFAPIRIDIRTEGGGGCVGRTPRCEKFLTQGPGNFGLAPETLGIAKKYDEQSSFRTLFFEGSGTKNFICSGALRLRDSFGFRGGVRTPPRLKGGCLDPSPGEGSDPSHTKPTLKALHLGHCLRVSDLVACRPRRRCPAHNHHRTG